MRLVALGLVLAVSGCAPSASPPAASGMAVPQSATATPARTLTASPVPTVTAAPPPTASEWRRLAVVDHAPHVLGGWRAVRGTPFGYVALSGTPPAVWFSPDGRAWSETRLAVPEGVSLRADSLAAGERGFLVGGKYSPCSKRDYNRNPFGDCRGRPVSWTSGDGRSWTASSAWHGALGEPGRAGSLFHSVWAVPGAGWDAAQAFDPSDESDDFDLTGVAIWHSPDGLAWEQIKGQPAETDGCGTQMATGVVPAGADDTGRRLIVHEAWCPPARVWSSPDGRTWSPVGAFEAQWPTAAIGVVLPATGGRAWELLGWHQNAQGDSLGAAVWRSSDLEAWTMDLLPSDGATDGIVLAATRADDLTAAVGWSGGAPATWSTADGVTWRLAKRPSASIEGVASGPAGLIGLVTVWDKDGNRVTGFEAWRLEAAPAP
jgi:hypothetical protein